MADLCLRLEVSSAEFLEERNRTLFLEFDSYGHGRVKVDEQNQVVPAEEQSATVDVIEVLVYAPNKWSRFSLSSLPYASCALTIASIARCRSACGKDASVLMALKSRSTNVKGMRVCVADGFDVVVVPLGREVTLSTFFSVDP
jgi:hypothetical protein